jgi:hypothetical protein
MQGYLLTTRCGKPLHHACTAWGCGAIDPWSLVSTLGAACLMHAIAPLTSLLISLLSSFTSVTQILISWVKKTPDGQYVSYLQRDLSAAGRAGCSGPAPGGPGWTVDSDCRPPMTAFNWNGDGAGIR